MPIVSPGLALKDGGVNAESGRTDRFAGPAWDSAYSFEVIDGAWRTIRASDLAVVLTADTAWELRELVRADYAARQRAVRGEAGCPQERTST
jgi:hypothetical protein